VTYQATIERDHAVAIDVGRFLRLQGAITSALAAVPVEQAAMTGEALPTSYTRLRGEAIDIIPAKVRDEFERLFPEHPFTRRGHTSGPRFAIETANRANEARAILGTLAGWLGGFVAEARMKQEAAAYAQARIKAERGTGFAAS
jgi:hypothetical protein